MEIGENDDMMRDVANYSLLQHNTFGIDAKCLRFLEYTDVKEAQQVAAILRESCTPFIIIGGGSNLLLTQDYEGVVVHSAIKGKKIVGSRMCCGSGEVWDDVVAFAVYSHRKQTPKIQVLLSFTVIHK